MGSLSRRGAVALGVLATVLAAGLYVWSQADRVPVAEARRFFHRPIEVGDVPPPPAGEPLARAEAKRLYDSGRVAFGKNDYTRAADDFSAVVGGDPAGPFAGSAQWNLIRSRMRSGDGNGALQAFELLTGHYAGYLGAEAPALREGLDHMARSDMAAAEVSFDRMIEEQPTSELVPLAHAMKGRIYWNQRQPMKAVGAFADMLASVRDDVGSYQELAGLLERYSEGDAQVAEEFAARAKRADDEGFGDIYRYVAARSLLEQNRFEEAREAFEELRANHPDEDFSHVVDLEHAWNLQRNGRPAEALVIFERLEGVPAPESAQAFDRFFDLPVEYTMGIARCQSDLGNYDQAIAAFQRALDEHPRSIYVLENRMGMAVAYERLGDRDKAKEILRATIEQHPDAPELWAVEQQLARVESQR